MDPENEISLQNPKIEQLEEEKDDKIPETESQKNPNIENITITGNDQNFGAVGGSGNEVIMGDSGRQEEHPHDQTSPNEREDSPNEARKKREKPEIVNENKHTYNFNGDKQTIGKVPGGGGGN